MTRMMPATDQSFLCPQNDQDQSLEGHYSPYARAVITISGQWEQAASDLASVPSPVLCLGNVKEENKALALHTPRPNILRLWGRNIINNEMSYDYNVS